MKCKMLDAQKYQFTLKEEPGKRLTKSRWPDTKKKKSYSLSHGLKFTFCINLHHMKRKNLLIA